METNLMLAYLGIALMVGVAGIGSAIGLSFCGQAVIGAMKKDSTKMGQYIALSALPSSQGLYGFISYYFASTLISPEMSVQVAAAILFCGLLVGVVGLGTAWKQGQILASGIAATADGHNVFVASMVMAVFPELYAILGTLVAILTFTAL